MGPCLGCGGPRWQAPPYHDEGELCGNCTRGTGMDDGFRPEYYAGEGDASAGGGERGSGGGPGADALDAAIVCCCGRPGRV